MGMFGPSKFSRHYASGLKTLSGPELAAQFQGMISVMSEEQCQVSDRDRAGYLILENLPRVGEQVEQVRFVSQYLLLNKNPSRGVRRLLGEWLETATSEAIEQLVAALISESIKAAEDDIVRYPSSKHQPDGDFLLRLCIDLAIQYRIKSALTLVRQNANLQHGETMILSRVMACAMLLEDVVLQEKFLQRLMSPDANSWVDEDQLVAQAFELVKQDQFASYRTKLFDSIHRWYVKHFSIERLEILAKMALESQNVLWHETVYREAARIIAIPNVSCGYEVYGVLMMLAPVHEKSKKKVDSMPRPESRFVLSLS